VTTRPVRSIAGQLNSAQLAISNSLSDPEIQSLVAQFGYPAEKTQRRQSPVRLPRWRRWTPRRRRPAGGKNPARCWRKPEESARDAYQALAKVARAGLSQGQGSVWSALGLNGNMPKDTAGFLAAALHPVR